MKFAMVKCAISLTIPKQLTPQFFITLIELIVDPLLHDNGTANNLFCQFLLILSFSNLPLPTPHRCLTCRI